MPGGLRRFAWGSFVLAEAVLILAGTAYVGVGTRDFWLMLAAGVIAAVAYGIAVRRTPEPTLGDPAGVPQRWYWF